MWVTALLLHFVDLIVPTLYSIPKCIICEESSILWIVFEGYLKIVSFLPVRYMTKYYFFWLSFYFYVIFYFYFQVVPSFVFALLQSAKVNTSQLLQHKLLTKKINHVSIYVDCASQIGIVGENVWSHFNERYIVIDVLQKV